MPISVQRDDRRRYMEARVTGLLAPRELIDFIRNDRAGDYGQYALLFDATGAHSDARPEDVKFVLQTVLTQVAAGSRRGPVAIVASSRMKELAALYEAACHGAGLHVIRVFRDRADAERWLTDQTRRPTA